MRIASRAAPPAAATYNVKTFGAVGDGNNDDTAAVQACVNAAIAQLTTTNPQSPVQAALITFPSGKYKLTGTITLALGGSGISLTFMAECVRGPGSNGPVVLYVPNPTGNTFTVTGSAPQAVTFCGFDVSYGGGTGGSFIDATAPGIGMANLTILDCNFTSIPASLLKSGAAVYVGRTTASWGAAVAAAHCIDGLAAGNSMTVEDCLLQVAVSTVTGEAINAGSCFPLLVHDNYILGGSTAGHGIDVSGAAGEVSNNYMWQSTVHASSAPSNLTIHDNHVHTAITGVGAASVYVHHNTGHNPVGHGVAQPAIAASGTAVTNTTGVDCTVHVVGGTVTAIAIGGVNTGLVSGSFRVPAGQSITLTYTLAPTWQWFGD